MGAGASNVSKTKLDVFQSISNQIMQNIESSASNTSKTSIDIDQKIKFINGSNDSINGICNSRAAKASDCSSKCFSNVTPIYNIKVMSGGAISGITSDSLCDKAFESTIDEVFSDPCGYCSGNPKTSECKDKGEITIDKRIEMCKKYAKRNNCISSGEGFSSFEECKSELPPDSTFINVFFDSSKNNNIRMEISDDKINRFQCSSIMPKSSNKDCYFRIDNRRTFSCIHDSSTINENLTQVERDLIRNNCIKDCNLFKCTQQELIEFKPVTPVVDVKGNIVLSNDMDNSVVINQLAESQVTAQMKTDLTNKATSEVFKEISQKNKGLNINQENSSDERTNITQMIKNAVSQAISGRADNFNRTEVNGVQTIEFINNGVIKSDGDLILSNKSINDINNSQTATSVVNAVMDTVIKNDLTSKYTFKLSQTNEGIDPFAILGMILMIIVAVVAGFILITATGGMQIAKTLIIGISVLGGIALVGFIVYIIVAVSNGKQPLNPFSNNPDQDPAGTKDQEPPTPESNPNFAKTDENKCETIDTAGCKCTFFIKNIGSSDDINETCANLKSDLETSGKSKEDGCKILVDKKILWNNTTLTSEFCNNSCPNRNFVNDNIRVYCE